MADAIRVQGLREFVRACDKGGKDVKKEVRSALKQVAEPVRRDAALLAVSSIPNIGLKWSQMRVGGTQSTVYVAPKQRSRSKNPALKRPNLAPLLMSRAMEPALAQNRDLILRRMEDALDNVGRHWEHD